MKGELLFDLDFRTHEMPVSNVNHKLVKIIQCLATALAPVITSCGFQSIRWQIDDEHTICIRKLYSSRFGFTAYFVR